MTSSYLPASLTGILSWPVRRDDAPESKSDRILTMGIVGGIILLFIVPPTWYFIARTIRLRRARLKGKDVEQGVQTQTHTITMTNSLSVSLSVIRRKEGEELPEDTITYIILGICFGSGLCIMLIWSIVLYCRKRRLNDIEQGHELPTVEAAPR
ncbi:hypothetical protein CEK26_010647 [Fusarium fujikuroi]|nr:hypothetical protein CEK27_010661 [Fusarium fujikuroi]QGI83928.1 hypothetical protein CEK25_010657 [Fusarium fujikuroi]QGI97578.1 hypothetical protein CEK26_010647 [Fusarium fujikuroi]